MLRACVIALVSVLLGACVGNDPSPRCNQLRVALFPYLPDAAGDSFHALTRQIEDEFERANPTVDLVLRRIDPAENFYDCGQVARILAGWNGEPGVDLVEVDTLLLDELRSDGLIQPWPDTIVSPDWHPAAAKAVTLKGKSYAVPHWLCGHFVVTRDAKVAQASTAPELVTALRAASPDRPNLSANFLGSWNLPCLYLDAYVDSQQAPANATAVLNPAVVASLKAVCKEVARGGNNPGTDGTFDNWEKPDLAADEFAEGKSDAFLGYSERLHVILKKDTVKQPVFARSASLGSGNHPVVFIDGFALKNGIRNETIDAARRFAEYINRPQTFEWIILSRDAAQKIPRYLLPATKSAYQTPSVARDPYFPGFYRELEHALPFPNNDLYNLRSGMAELLKAELDKP